MNNDVISKEDFIERRKELEHQKEICAIKQKIREYEEKGGNDWDYSNYLLLKGYLDKIEAMRVGESSDQYYARVLSKEKYALHQEIKASLNDETELEVIEKINELEKKRKEEDAEKGCFGCLIFIAVLLVLFITVGLIGMK